MQSDNCAAIVFAFATAPYILDQIAGVDVNARDSRSCRDSLCKLKAGTLSCLARFLTEFWLRFILTASRCRLIFDPSARIKSSSCCIQAEGIHENRLPSFKFLKNEGPRSKGRSGRNTIPR